mmetsp:Transcript_26579/g.48945  ORF Transcript_26579/g.48945 Transcript_26579/m.48945 type:complete len:80 (-) Transcript_26579:276-515(-)
MSMLALGQIYALTQEKFCQVEDQMSRARAPNQAYGHHGYDHEYDSRWHALSILAATGLNDPQPCLEDDQQEDVRSHFVL